MFDVVALGEALIDFTYNGLSKDNQKLFEQNAGGAPCNMLAAVSSCKMKTAFIGKVGEDMHGYFLKETMQNANIDISGVISSKDYFTTLAFVDINDKGERSFSFARKSSADVMLKKEEINIDIIKKSKVFHFGSLSLTQNPSKEATFFALEKAKEYNCVISYDPNYRASLWANAEAAKKEMRSVLKYVDIIKISDEECELITGEKEPDKAGKILNDMGISIALITLGSKGSLAFINGESKFVKGFKAKEVVDTTGAGDSFFGGFIYKFLKEDTFIKSVSLKKSEEFLLFANALASLCIEKRGGIPSIPSLENIQARIKEGV